MKKFKTAEGYLQSIEDDLENANHHDYIELPRKLFNKIVNLECACFDTNEDELILAQTIAEEFDRNI